MIFYSFIQLLRLYDILLFSLWRNYFLFCVSATLALNFGSLMRLFHFLPIFFLNLLHFIGFLLLVKCESNSFLLNSLFFAKFCLLNFSFLALSSFSLLVGFFLHLYNSILLVYFLLFLSLFLF
jgi:hypothetical protein